jgi:hypothetical protein
MDGVGGDAGCVCAIMPIFLGGNPESKESYSNVCRMGGCFCIQSLRQHHKFGFEVSAEKQRAEGE